MKTCIIVPNWNGADFIIACLESLINQTKSCSIIVVDNGSVDNSVSLIETRFPEVILIKNTKNIGFAGGVNIGIRYALESDFEAVALFNNDASAEKNWLETLVKKLEEDSKLGIVTGKLMRNDRIHFDSTGDFYSTRGIPFPRGRNVKDTGQYDRPEYVFAASGGGSLYRSTMLRAIGLFDERFFAYYEDVDISFRARLAGWEIAYSPTAVAYHHISATSSGLGTFSHYHSNKNFYYLYLKNMPATLFFKYLHSFLYQAARSCASSLLTKRMGSYGKAMASVLVHLPSIFVSRYRIQKGKIVEDAAIKKYIHVGKPPVSPDI